MRTLRGRYEDAMKTDVIKDLKGEKLAELFYGGYALYADLIYLLYEFS